MTRAARGNVGKASWEGLTSIAPLLPLFGDLFGSPTRGGSHANLVAAAPLDLATAFV